MRPGGYRLPIRTWEALDKTVGDQEKRIASLEGKTTVILAVLAILVAMNTAILTLAARGFAGG